MNSNGTNITKRLAEFLFEINYKDIPSKVVQQSKKAMIDFIGVALFGATYSSTKKMLSFVKSVGGNPQALVLGNGFKTSAQTAAFANGYMAHVADWDDTITTMRAHPSVTIFPAILALGEMLNVTGDKILESYVLGVEIGAKIGRGINPEHSKHWHATGTLGALGAAAGSAKILGLDIEETQAAMGIAASGASGLRKHFGTDVKPIQAGNAARGGVVAALLAKEGLRGDPNILEGQHGFCNIYCGEEYYHLDKIVENLGDPFEIDFPGINIKKYPSCSRTHTGIDAILFLIQQHNLKSDDIDEICCGVSYTTSLSLLYPNPQTGLEAQFSMEFCIAVALLDGNVCFEQFTDEKVSDPRVQNLMKKIHLYIHPDLKGVESSASNTCILHVRLKNGNEYEMKVDKNKGSAQNPLSKKELESKFIDCTKSLLTQSQAFLCLTFIENLEELDSFQQLTEII